MSTDALMTTLKTRVSLRGMCLYVFIKHKSFKESEIIKASSCESATEIDMFRDGERCKRCNTDINSAYETNQLSKHAVKSCSSFDRNINLRLSLKAFQSKHF